MSLGALLGAGFCLERPAHATTVLGLSLDDLVGHSLLVVEGRAVAARSQWASHGQRRRIVTVTRVVTDSLWACDASLDPALESECEVLTLGGRVDDIAQKVHGEAELPQGQPLVLFLSGADPAERRVVGMAQGQFSIRKQAGREHLVRSAALPELWGGSNGAKATPTAVGALHRLDKLEARQLVSDSFGKRKPR